MLVAIRVDSSIKMGTGHVMRCLTLAEELRQKQAKVVFISRAHVGNLNSLIVQKGFEVYQLVSSESAPLNQKLVQFNSFGMIDADICYEDWLGVSWEEDANQTVSIIEKLCPDWLVVDHYAIDYRWESQLKPFCGKLMAIDDLADRNHMCDLLLDQTYGRELRDYESHVPLNTILMLGAQFSLLRSEFREWREVSLKRRVHPEFQQLIITMGGADPDNVTGDVLKTLKNGVLPCDVRLLVIMGESAPWLNEVSDQLQQMTNPTELKVGVNNMAELMTYSDLAIGAAGSTVWERCCLGLPSIMYTLAKNQEDIAKKIQLAGAAFFGGSVNEVKSSLAQSVAHMSDVKVLEGFVNESKMITDGCGVTRVSEMLICEQ